MPKKKLQLKLLSNSGELLNVVTCHAGQISVFRATTQADLRPYQRALAGSQGGSEKFSILVDGKEYHPDEHNLIGFSEAPPYVGLTVMEYLASVGLPEGAADAVLMSFGLEGTHNKKCSALSPDEERRVRLLAGTANPDKLLILNEPFDPVSQQWRDRLAEYLVSFACNQRGLVVVTGLSFRPECWIDNEYIARIKVGETLQKTVGFGSAGAQDVNVVQQLRDMIQADPTLQTQTNPNAHRRQQASAAGSFGSTAAFSMASNSSDAAWTAAEEVTASELTTQSGPDLFTRVGSSAQRMLSLIGGGAVLIVGTYFTTRMLNPAPDDAPPTKDVATQLALETGQELAAVDKLLSGNTNTAGPDQTSQQPPLPVEQPNQEVARVQPPSTSHSSPPLPPPTELNVLDDYPESVRISLIDTARGVVDRSITTTAASASTVPSTTAKPETGNLFKLLENASNTQPEPPGGGPSELPPPDYEQPSQPEWQAAPQYDTNAGDEQVRREAIRQKFLEAIRAAAERRQAGGDEGL
jgi:hypothetical protein